MAATKSSDAVGQGIQLAQKGNLVAAKEQLQRLGTPLSGDGLYLAARIAEAEQDWQSAITLYQQYLSSTPFSVHRLEARASFTLLRAHRNDPLLGEYLYLTRLRDLNQISQLQTSSARLYAAHSDEPLAIRGQLLAAYSLLEVAQRPQQAHDLYLLIAQNSKGINGDWYMQALFGAAFAAIRINQPVQAQSYIELVQQEIDSTWGRQNTLLARSWQNRIDAMKFILPLSRRPADFEEPFLWGVGARLLLDNPVGSGQQFAPIWQTLSDYNLNVNSVTLWITQESDWNWLRADLLRGAHNKGFVPMINYWYFGDAISPEYVTQNRDKYLTEVKTKLIPLLKDLPQAYLILEPEFNKQGIESWDGWDPLMLEVIALVRKAAPQVKIGLGLGDWDAPGAAPSYASAERAIEASDFVASMLMLSTYTERSHAAPDWSAWVRALRLGERLKTRFNKPWMLAYLSIASQPAWEPQQAIEVQKLEFYLPMLRNLGLFALNWFSLTDEPDQTGWFADAEQSFGLLNASYSPKPAFDHYRQLVDKHKHELTPPAVVSFDAEVDNQRLEISATFGHWTYWQLTIKQGNNQWSKRGVGDSFSIHWQGQMLPSWAQSGDISLTLTANNATQPTITRSWNAPVNNQSVQLRQPVTLSTWERWQQLPPQPIQQQQLGTNNHASIELVIKEINNLKLDSLQVGLVDQQGFQQTLSAAAYAYQDGESIALHIPLIDFSSEWVRYDANGAQWQQQASGWISVMLQNSAAQPMSFEVQGINSFVPD